MTEKTSRSVYKRLPRADELPLMGNYSEKKLGERVYLVKHRVNMYELLVHHCPGNAYYTEMTFRENDDGPMYWCEGCGFVLGNGEAMAIRLYEAPF